MKITKLFTIAAATVALSLSLFAAGEKETTLTGKGECAKCSLGKTKACQMALTVKEDGKEKTYLLENNDITKAFHKNICKEDKEVKVTGTVKEVDGKKVIEAKKVELAKK